MSLRRRVAILVSLLLLGFALAAWTAGRSTSVAGLQPAVAALGVLLVANALAWHRWVLRPLGHITNSLANESSVGLQPLANTQSELGRVAKFIAAHNSPRENPKENFGNLAKPLSAFAGNGAIATGYLEERARLGRDLHDGILQSLYAAGMNIAGIKALLRPEQDEAIARLERARVVLNETMQDVRNFIEGLEPEALKTCSFRGAIETLAGFMQSVRPFQATVEIDDAQAQQLSPAQRVHALQIAREAISNALRHGRANHVQVSLRSSGTATTFAIVDDGCGFNRTSPLPSGHGLANFMERARDLGAMITIDSIPGQGTRVELVLPL